MAWPIIKETVEDFCSTQNIPITTLSMADLGCSSGSNTLMIISNLIKQVELHTNKPTQYQIFFNDLPSNDFNAIFRSLPNCLQELKNQVGDDFGNNCFFNGVSGSFYGRLFPNKSLHFVHSSYSVHWLSQVILKILCSLHIKNLNFILYSNTMLIISKRIFIIILIQC